MEDHAVTHEVNDFLQNYFPSHGADSFDKLVADLKKQKVLVARAKSPNRASFHSSEGHSHTLVLKTLKTLFERGAAHPSGVVKSMQTIVNSVRKALKRVKGAHVNQLLVREDDVGASSTDASLTENRDGPMHPTDIAVPFSVLPETENAQSHNACFISRMIRVMNEDARRKFLYGITVRGTDITLWCISRSHVVKSTPFSCLEHSAIFIRAITSLLSATDDRLGYDPLITLLPDGSYVYTLPPDGSRTAAHFYQTVELVSEFHSSDPGGRTSRIWKVRQVTSPSDPSPISGTADMILKDATLDARLPTEADNQRQLFDDITAFAKDENWRARPIVKEFTARDLDILSDALEGDNFKRYFACITASYVSAPCTVAGGDLCPEASNPARHRCFFIFDSICTPLHDIPTLGDAMDILVQSLTALQLMFCAGWVHRDVSSGNILAVQLAPGGPWQVKLSDMEYARRFPRGGVLQDKGKIGTPYFMATELLMLNYFYRPDAYDDEDEDDDDDGPPLKPVVHNYQHDLEAIWWIALWLATIRVRQGRPHPVEVIHFQHSLGGIYATNRRTLFLSNLPLAMDPFAQRTFPSSLPSAFIRSLHKLRKNLRVQYHSRNGDNKQDEPGTYSWISSQGFSSFLNGIEECRDQWAGIELFVESDLRRQRQQRRQPPPPPKRKPEDDGQGRPEGEDRLENQQRPKKKSRVAPQAPQRAGPVTRSMTRSQVNTGPLTRAAVRRLQESKAKGGNSKPIVGSAIKHTRR
ncbi:other/FunK1 protein kinase [Coprinopsis cinerea AmutBmut pab1-1]|nr:other/FunK1 protein kinase [Coprinopsis cinerea AmutBmut pab1-1]